ncbi:MAG: hypothetical protein SFU99_13240 [Saprospiraceae bacterium]|nr:hypothetical protein [Saprospiraceae bacterium]
MLETLTIADFKPHLNQALSIRFTPEVTLPATLTAVTAWGSESDKFRQPFTLEFRTTQKNEYYQQGTFMIVHPALGELPVFMVPLGPDSEGMRYEVVFS